jgi:hypothetical protein
MNLTLTDLEQAINFWRTRHPSTGEEQKLCPEANALATPYAQMIVLHLKQIEVESLSDQAQGALTLWRQLQQAAAQAEQG